MSGGDFIDIYLYEQIYEKPEAEIMEILESEINADVKKFNEVLAAKNVSEFAPIVSSIENSLRAVRKFSDSYLIKERKHKKVINKYVVHYQDLRMRAISKLKKEESHYISYRNDPVGTRRMMASYRS